MTEKSSFSKWLKQKMLELNTDENIFGSYIMGILEGDETLEEKREALEGILSEIIENDLEKVISDILQEWEKYQPNQAGATSKEIEDVDTKLAKLLENKQITTTVQRQYTEEELRIREQILSQYSTVELDDDYDDDINEGTSKNDGGKKGGSSDSSDPFLVKNTNAADVAQLHKERREQAKLDSKAKKDKDKEDREKQKQLREEKKEKRKTVKGERKR